MSTTQLRKAILALHFVPAGYDRSIFACFGCLPTHVLVSEIRKMCGTGFLNKFIGIYGVAIERTEIVAEEHGSALVARSGNLIG